MPDLCLIVPSRNRPQNIARLIDCMKRNSREGSDLLVGLDADDPELPAYKMIIESYGSPHFRYTIQPDLHHVVAWSNLLARQEQDHYYALGCIGDDNVLNTEGWDSLVLEALYTDNIYFCFGDDKYPGRPPGSLSCHIFMRTAVPKALGYVGPPSIKHMYVDPVWYAWGQGTGIKYIPNLDVEHLHYSCGKSQGDASYSESSALMGPDLVAYNAYCDDPNGLNADIAKISAIAHQFSEQELHQFNHDLNIPPNACGHYTCTLPVGEH